MDHILQLLKEAWPVITGTLAFIGTLFAFREYFLLPRKARQEVLDALPDPERKGWYDMQQSQTLDQQIDFVHRNGLELASLNASLPRQSVIYIAQFGN